jgi:hypothetical protein
MNDLLQMTLSAIAAERSQSFDASFDLVDDVLEVYGVHQLFDRLYDDIPDTYEWELIADLFVLLMWAIGSDGVALTAMTESWLLQGDNLRKIQIALHLDVYPFDDPEQMRQVLSVLAGCYPDVASKCQELIISRLGADRPTWQLDRLKQWLHLRRVVWTSLVGNNMTVV